MVALGYPHHARDQFRALIRELHGQVPQLFAQLAVMRLADGSPDADKLARHILNSESFEDEIWNRITRRQAVRLLDRVLLRPNDEQVLGLTTLGIKSDGTIRDIEERRVAQALEQRFREARGSKPPERFAKQVLQFFRACAEAERQRRRKDQKAGQHSARTTRDEPEAIGGAGQPFNAPPSRRRFVGRDPDLEVVHMLLGGDRAAEGRVLALHGYSGVGKSQLAIEYAHRYRHHYPGGVFWLPVRSRSRHAVFSELARLCEIEPHSDEAQLAERVWKHFASTPAALVVFDNFPTHAGDSNDPSSPGPWLPPGGQPRTLITSTHRFVSVASHRVDTLGDDAALSLLTREQGSDDSAERTAACEIARRLGNLPLALELVGAYLEFANVGYQSFAATLDRTAKLRRVQEIAEWYHDRLPSGREAGIVAAFEETWRYAGHFEKLLLSVFSALTEHAVPTELALGTLERLSPGKVDVQERASLALANLVRYSVVQYATDTSLECHDLFVQFVTQSLGVKKRAAARKATVGQAVELAATWLYLDKENSLAGLLHCLELLPHAEEMAREAMHQRQNALAEPLLMFLTFTCFGLGWSEKAQAWAQQCGALAEKGGRSPALPHALVLQAVTLENSGKFEEARTAYRRALSLAEPAGKDATDADVRSRLARVLRKLGRLDEALTIARETVKLVFARRPPVRDAVVALASLGATQVRHSAQLREEGLRNLRKATELASDLPTQDAARALVFHDLGRALLRVDPAEAEVWLRRALEETERIDHRKNAVHPSHVDLCKAVHAQGGDISPLIEKIRNNIRSGRATLRAHRGVDPEDIPGDETFVELEFAGETVTLTVEDLHGQRHVASYQDETILELEAEQHVR